MEQLKIIKSFIAKVDVQWLAKGALVLGSVGVTWQTADIIWQIAEPAPQYQTWKPSPVNAGQQNSATNIDAIKEKNLFGKAGDKPKKVTPAPKPVESSSFTNAPKTSLRIQLTGVVASTSKENGIAIIESAGSQETYSINEKIKGTQATLSQVFADRAIISNAGKFETVMLDGLTYTSKSSGLNKQLAQGPKKPKREKTQGSPSVAQELLDSRDALMEDPSKIIEYFSFSPVTTGGELQGYRLNPGKKRDLFFKAGFKANDLAKSINGYDLTDTMQAMELMAELKELTEVSVMVERDGQLEEISLSAP